MIPFGTDFSFQYAESNYNYLAKLFNFVNSDTKNIGKKFRMRMSTVDEYFNAVREAQLEKNVQWPTYIGDFFPYNGQYVGHYWTGYFSSR